MKKNLILSIVSLCLASMLMVFMAFAWYTTNSKVSASVLNVKVDGKECDVTIETYQSGSWIELDDLVFDNIEPGDTFYFRLKVICASTSTINAEPSSYSSAAISGDDGLVVDLDEMEITYQGVSLFNIEDDYTVKIDDAVVYNINQTTGAITIVDDYGIANAFNTYNLGTSVTGAPSIAGLTGNDLDSLIFGDGVSLASGTSYAYFALEYEDYDSSTEADKEYASNNYFVYQVLTISALNVFIG